MSRWIGSYIDDQSLKRSQFWIDGVYMSYTRKHRESLFCSHPKSLCHESLVVGQREMTTSGEQGLNQHYSLEAIYVCIYVELTMTSGHHFKRVHDLIAVMDHE